MVCGRAHTRASARAMDLRMFELVVSPTDGIGDACVSAMECWVLRNASFYHVVLEGRGRDRRLRCLLLFAEPKSSRNMRQNVWERFVKPHHRQSVYRLAVSVEAAADSSWSIHTVPAREPQELICKKLPGRLQGVEHAGPVKQEVAPPLKHGSPPLEPHGDRQGPTLGTLEVWAVPPPPGVDWADRPLCDTPCTSRRCAGRSLRSWARGTQSVCTTGGSSRS